MKTEMIELTLNEMDLIAAGGAVHQCAKKKLFNKVVRWVASWF